MGKYMMALDQGTTSSRCILFDKQGKILSMAQKEFSQIYPHPGWVEHNPMEIWSSQLAVATEAMAMVGATAEDISGIGITNMLIDSGANVECTPEYLLQFAYMGSFYAQKQMGIPSPKVGLVNNGAESSKGTPMLKETYALLQQAGQAGRLNFIGNIEGRDVPFGAADVVLCDGFTGNILLKTYEGVGLYFAGEMKKMFTKSLGTKVGALLVKDGLQAFKKKMDYKEVGGAPLLGISKPVVKAHGSSDPRAFRSAIRQAIQYADSGIISSITENIQHMTLSAEEKN